MSASAALIFPDGETAVLLQKHELVHSITPAARAAVALCLTSRSPMLVWCGDERSLVYNDAAIALLGDAHPAALGRPHPDESSERWSALRNDLERARRDQRSIRGEEFLLTPILDGDQVVAIAGSPVAAQVDGTVDRSHDTFESEPVEAPRAKTDFLAMVGHELRNPLATVSTMLQALMLRGPNREVELMERAVRQLTRLVEDLIDSSRLARGDVQLQTRPIELAQIVDRALDQMASIVDYSRSKVVVSVPRVGCRVEADLERLTRALGNVLTNAAQHTPANRAITVEASCDEQRTRLRIADEGSGIAPDRIDHVFEAFQSQRTTGGLGLGLSLARSLIELHGGSIRLASEGAGHGTECTIELPSTTQPAVEPPVRARATRRRLLLVEDNDDAARALKTALEQLGYDVAIAHNAPIALNVARSYCPDVALLDLGLPVMDGWELARRLHDTSASLPIIAVTARDGDSDKQRSADLGFTEHLVKPIDLPRLQRIVDELSASKGEES